MKCVRCEKEFDSTIPELNAESYGSNILPVLFVESHISFIKQ